MHREVFGKRIGNRSILAVEFEAHGSPPPKIWNEWWGYLWLWVEGHVVGRPFEYEMIWTGLESLKESAGETGQRANDLLPARNSEGALDMVMWASYGNHDLAMEELIRDKGRLSAFEILPRRTGPFFDGWQAVLLEEGTRERFIYRAEGVPLAEVIWPFGTFRDVINAASSEFERLARSMLNYASAHVPRPLQ